MGGGKTPLQFIMKRADRYSLKEGDYIATFRKLGRFSEFTFGTVAHVHPLYMWAIISRVKRRDGEAYQTRERGEEIPLAFNASIYTLSDDEVLRHIMMESI